MRYSGSMLVRPALALVSASALVLGCAEPPVRWRESAAVPPAPTPEMRLAVDTADRGANGCRRPAASVAADAATGYVHVAYALVAPGAPGVFFAHSMPGHFMFHAPVPIVYGERPGRTSVAASGDVVAVAYEDPNAAEPRVGLALSRTLGHTFEHRVAASTGVGAAVEPRVALAGGTVAVAWRQGRSVRGLIGDAASAGGLTMVRLGELSGS